MIGWWNDGRIDDCTLKGWKNRWLDDGRIDDCKLKGWKNRWLDDGRRVVLMMEV